jgi:GNAT superfamily N-acetyltransferase
MREYVQRTWGWDEEDQRRRFAVSFPADRLVIIVGGEVAGYLDVDERIGETWLANIVLDPTVQGRGIGAALVGAVIRSARARRVPVALQVLRVNPARRLYERLGFVLEGETDTHFLMRTR